MLKRGFDVIVSSTALAFMSPIFLLMALAVKLDSPGPILFRQVRVGLHGVPFRIHKFRTMVIEAEASGKLTIGGDDRITRVGAFLRRYKLDELPQLLDVLSGRMSLVGPRPEVPEYVAYYAEASRALILSVRPGITDKASLAMFNEADILARYGEPDDIYVTEILPMKEQMYLDYVRNHTFFGDLRIIVATIRRLFH